MITENLMVVIPIYYIKSDDSAQKAKRRKKMKKKRKEKKRVKAAPRVWLFPVQIGSTNSTLRFKREPILQKRYISTLKRISV
jgi:hypothetical protein